MNHVLPYLVGLLIALLVVFYVYSAAVASWHLRNTTYFTRGQKLAQLAIVWLLPIVGVAFVLSMLSPEERKRRPGWVPLLEPFILAVFIHSASSAAEGNAHDSGSTDSTPSHDGGGDGGAD
jgi:Na+/H+ antiporter NhaD/arsenite permease-like protein